MFRTKNNNKQTNGHRILFIGGLCLFGICMMAQVEPEKKKMKITLLHADKTIQRESNRDLQILEGNVEFLYDSIYMTCDTAYNCSSRNYFEAFGNVVMNQGDTLFLYGDYLYYDGDERLVMVR